MQGKPYDLGSDSDGGGGAAAAVEPTIRLFYSHIDFAVVFERVRNCP